MLETHIWLATVLRALLVAVVVLHVDEEKCGLSRLHGNLAKGYLWLKRGLHMDGMVASGMLVTTRGDMAPIDLFGANMSDTSLRCSVEKPQGDQYQE